jgi:general secretion pathway protein L
MKLGVENWGGRLREAANRAGLPRFWRWWMGELAPLMPSASRIALQRRFVRPVIELSDNEALFWRPEFSAGPTRLVTAEKVSLIGDAAAVLAAGRAAVSRLAANASGGIAAPKVVIALSSRQVLRKEITLPAAVEENLTQALAYDLDRHTPFRAEQLYFDATILSRDSAKKTLRVDWAAALRSVVDDACRKVESWGAVPRAVVPGPPATSVRLNLIPEIARPRPLEWRRWQVWAPVAAVAAIALAAVIVPLAQKREYAIALYAIAADAEKEARAADSVRMQLEAMQNDYNYILAKKYAYPSVVHVLDEVTRALPDDTWLTQFELKTSGRGKETQRDLYLRGESGNAGKLIALLEDSKLVEQAAPRSPTTKIQGASGEIFDVGARLRTLSPPPSQALALDAMPVAAAPAAPAAAALKPAVAASAAAPGAAQAAAPPQAVAPPQAAVNIAAPAPAPAQEAAAAVAATSSAGFGPSPQGAPVLAPGATAQQPALRDRRMQRAQPMPATTPVPATPPPIAAPAAPAPTAAAPAVGTPPMAPEAAPPVGAGRQEPAEPAPEDEEKD